MLNDEETVPPRKANTPRNMIAWLMDWCREHPVWAALISGVAVGAILPSVVRWVW